MIDRPEEYEKMDLAEKELWWYRILHQQTIGVIQKKYLTKDVAILDAACGTGGLINSLQANGYLKIKGFDLSSDAVQRSLQKTKADIAQLSLQDAATYYAGQSFDVIICNDALIYLRQADDLPRVISEWMNMLNKNGTLIINLPALNIFKGMHDISVGISERWTIGKFEKILLASSISYKKLEYSYWPFLLSPLILTARIIQRWKLKLSPGSPVSSDVAVPHRVLNHIFYKLTKWESYLPFKRKFGSSLFIVIHR
jgi:SAM-dependent methyltransferase